MDTILVAFEAGPVPVLAFTFEIGESVFTFENPVRVSDLEITSAPDKITVHYADEDRQAPFSMNDLNDENSDSGTNDAVNFGSNTNMDDISFYLNYDISLGDSDSETIWKIETLDGFATYAWLSFQGEPGNHNFLD